MHQRHRFLIAVLAALAFLAPGALAGGPKPPRANARKAQKIKPYKAPKINKRNNKIKPSKRAR